MSLATWRLRRRLQPHLAESETWQTAARDQAGTNTWWVVTSDALILASPSGEPTQRVPREEIIDVQSTGQHTLRVRTAKDGFLIGSFARSDRIAESLGAHP